MTAEEQSTSIDGKPVTIPRLKLTLKVSISSRNQADPTASNMAIEGTDEVASAQQTASTGKKGKTQKAAVAKPRAKPSTKSKKSNITEQPTEISASQQPSTKQTATK